MNILVEGVDDSGKSTLVTQLSWRYSMEVIRSEGPSQGSGEIQDRCARYSAMNNVIFDRHPCVSEIIYGTERPKEFRPPAQFISDFYLSKPVIIYCDPWRSPVIEKKGSYDSPEHLMMVRRRYFDILQLYRNWACEHAHYVYRVPASYGYIFAGLDRFFLPQQTDPQMFSDIKEFHEKFNLAYSNGPRGLPAEVEEFRIKFMREELEEYITAEMLTDKLDALVDLVYVALGTAYLHGFPFNTAWRRVHEANMKKVRAMTSAESKRASAQDVIKPEDWKPADLTDLVR